MQERVDKLRRKLESLGVDAVLVSDPYNRVYLTGFTGTYGYAVIGKERNIFITDFRYVQQVKRQCKGFEIVTQEKSMIETILDVLKSLNVTNLGFEEDYVTYKHYLMLKETFRDINILPTENIIQKMREIKDANEVSKIRKAASIADNAFSYILNVIKPGITERDIALELEFNMKKNGASALSFDTIVASGLRSAMPHGIASDKIIEFGDVITLDFGCIYDGYCSDMTRTIFVGKINEKIKELYEIVFEAQNSSLEALTSGAISRDVDGVARGLIKDKGYGENFGHGLGHSVGLEIHEEPRLSPNYSTILQSGMIVTVEPGIYIEDVGGVRIEDMVLITNDGYDNLVTASKEIIVV